MNRSTLFALLLTIAATPAMAQATTTAPDAAARAARAVSLDNAVLVERIATDPTGKTRVTLAAPDKVVPGDNLVFVLSYRNRGAEAASAFVVTNPLPAAVRFTSVADSDAVVSVDGGRSWGALSALRVRDGAVQRAATADDVTHVRWAFARPIPAGGSGKLMFRGVVR